MKIAEILTLYAFSRWANGRLIAAAGALSAEQFVAPTAFPHGSLRGTLGHMIRTERFWCAVLRGDELESPTMLSNERLTSVDVLAARWDEVQAESRAYIASLADADLARVVPQRSGGALSVWQILLNTYTHNAQHRAEVAQILTEYGCSPGDIDYLFFALDNPFPE